MMKELQTIPIWKSFFAEQEKTLVTWVGMAGALINARGTIVLIDPLIATKIEDGQEVSEEGFRLKVPLPVEAGEIPKVDAVMYTHADNDHLGRLTAKILAERLDCLFIAPPPVGQALQEEGIPAERITIAHDFDVLQMGQVEVNVTPALHNWQEVNPWQRGDCCGYLLKTADGTIWHPGDTRLIDELLAYQDVDVMFFDVADVDTHLGPAGSAALAKSSGAKVMVAYHYGTFDLPPGSFGGCDPEDALPYVQDLAGTFVQLNPGEVLELPL